MGDQGPQLLLVSVQGLDSRRRRLAAEGHDRDHCELQVGRHADRRNGDRMSIERGVEHLAARQNLGQRMPD